VLDTLLADRTSRGLAAPPLVEMNIDDDEDLHRRFVFTIPVIAFGDRELGLATTPAKLRRFLDEVLDPVPGAPG
jgi:hypothetical protein